MSEERLQKILARAGLTSRRKAEEIIDQGRVTVNGEMATIGDKADPDTDFIKVDGKRIEPRTHFHYLLLHKPDGVMSTRHDPEGRPTVLELVPPKYHKALVPVGRLDFHSEGLLILTDDGEFAHRVAHPRYGCTKTYEVKVKDEPPAEGIRRLLERGEVIEGRRVIPVRVEQKRAPGPREGKNTWWTVEVSEGRTRQIREMFFRMGHSVQRLRRVAIGPLRDTDLAPGAFRELTEGEVELLRRATRKRKPRPRSKSGAGGSGGKTMKGSAPKGGGRTKGGGAIERGRRR